MNFNYDAMPRRNKENNKGEIMRECNNCGERTYMLYHEDENYEVVCENCDETHKFKSNSMEKAMKKWKQMDLIADCENCPLGWEERGYEGECYDCGCMVHADKIPCDETSWCRKTYAERLEKSKEFE